MALCKQWHHASNSSNNHHKRGRKDVGILILEPASINLRLGEKSDEMADTTCTISVTFGSAPAAKTNPTSNLPIQSAATPNTARKATYNCLEQSFRTPLSCRILCQISFQSLSASSSIASRSPPRPPRFSLTPTRPQHQKASTRHHRAAFVYPSALSDMKSRVESMTAIKVVNSS